MKTIVAGGNVESTESTLMSVIDDYECVEKEKFV